MDCFCLKFEEASESGESTEIVYSEMRVNITILLLDRIKLCLYCPGNLWCLIPIWQTKDKGYGQSQSLSVFWPIVVPWDLEYSNRATVTGKMCLA